MNDKTQDENVSKSNTLNVPEQLDKSRDKIIAELALSGIASNASLVVKFGKCLLGEIDFTECATVLADKAKKIRSGDLQDVETLLVAQASALDVIFSEMAYRARLNMGEYVDAADRYMRLALKAQGQCRATLETLATIKNPPVVIARQANVSHGPQQVNNTVHTNTAPNLSTSTHAPACAENSKSVQNELLEQRHDEHLDIGAPGAAVTGDPAMATVGKIYRPPHD